MQIGIKRRHLSEQRVDHSGKIIGRHVVARTPHRTGIGKAKFARASIGDFDHADIIAAHWLANHVPACPDFLGQFGVTRRSHEGFKVIAASGDTLECSLALAIGRLQPRGQRCQFIGSAGSIGRRQDNALFEKIQLAANIESQIRCCVELRRLLGELDGQQRAFGSGPGIEIIGIIGDVGRIHPGNPGGIIIIG